MFDAPNELERLYEEEGRRILAYLRRRVRRSVEADDLLQEVMAVAAAKLGRVDPLESGRAWLLGIARRLLLAHWRERREEPVADLELTAPAEDGEDPRLEAVRRAMSRLPAGQREALELRFEQELSYEEIATALDVPVGTVRSRLHNAIRAIREAACPADEPGADSARATG